MPLLQDDTTVKASWNSGASSHYVYVLDGDRNVRIAHYHESTAFASDGERLIEWVDEVLASR